MTCQSSKPQDQKLCFSTQISTLFTPRHQNKALCSRLVIRNISVALNLKVLTWSLTFDYIYIFSFILTKVLKRFVQTYGSPNFSRKTIIIYQCLFPTRHNSSIQSAASSVAQQQKIFINSSRWNWARTWLPRDSREVSNILIYIWSE